jgi:hypothetical protein
MHLSYVFSEIKGFVLSLTIDTQINTRLIQERVRLCLFIQMLVECVVRARDCSENEAGSHTSHLTSEATDLPR